MSNFCAVLVGINKNKDRSVTELRGCVNDVLVMRDILRIKYGVQSNQVRVVTDERATDSSILDRLKWLVEKSYSVKNLLFWISSHGTQIPNTDYKERDEYDGLDEVIVPYNFDWDHHYISDDHIRAVLSKLNPEAKLSMVFDCCHSGTMLRNIGKDNKIPRFVPIHRDLLCRVPDTDAAGLVERSLHTEIIDEHFWDLPLDSSVQPDVKVHTSLRDLSNVEGKRVISISGCKDDQTSADAYLYNRFQGALSFSIQRSLMNKPDLSSLDLVAETTKVIKSLRFEQDPVLSAYKDDLQSEPFISTK